MEKKPRSIFKAAEMPRIKTVGTFDDVQMSLKTFELASFFVSTWIRGASGLISMGLGFTVKKGGERFSISSFVSFSKLWRSFRHTLKTNEDRLWS